MYTTKSGRKFGSAFVGRRHDQTEAEPSDEKGMKKKLGSALSDKVGELGEELGEKQDNAAEEAKEHPVVTQHGKATTVHIKHDHAANKHHVTSTHEDGYTDESDHEDAGSAHKHAAALAGVEKPEMAPEEQDANLNEGGVESDGFDMPGL
jgi:hypothetical protein